MKYGWGKLNSTGMTMIEVVVAASLLSLTLLAIANYSVFSSKSSKSTELTSNFAAITGSIDQIIKTPACDQLLANIPFNDSVTTPQEFNGFNPVGAFNLAKPAVTPTKGPAFIAPNFIAPVSGSAPFLLTLVRKAALTSGIGGRYFQDTVDVRVTLQKVDGSGNALNGSPLETKDFTLNLWVDRTANKLIPGTCTWAPAVVLNPVAAPSCATAGAPITVTWTEQNGTYASVTPEWPPVVSLPVSGAGPSYTFPLVAPTPSPGVSIGYPVQVTEFNGLGPGNSALTNSVVVENPPTLAAVGVATPAVKVSSVAGFSQGNVFTTTTTDTAKITIQGSTAQPTKTFPITTGTTANTLTTSLFSCADFAGGMSGNKSYTVTASNACGATTKQYPVVNFNLCVPANQLTCLMGDPRGNRDPYNKNTCGKIGDPACPCTGVDDTYSCSGTSTTPTGCPAPVASGTLRFDINKAPLCCPVAGPPTPGLCKQYAGASCPVATCGTAPTGCYSDSVPNTFPDSFGNPTGCKCPAAVPGVCGDDNGKTLVAPAAPKTDGVLLCNSGTASGVSQTTPTSNWTWNCVGTGSRASDTATCAATPSPSPSCSPTFVVAAPRGITCDTGDANYWHVRPETYPGAGSAYYVETANAGDYSNTQEPVIRCTNFGINIPTDATVQGVAVTVEADADSGSGGVINTVGLSLGGSNLGSPVSPAQSIVHTHPKTWPEYTYGGSTSQWGNALSPAIVNDSSFGLYFQEERNGSRIFAHWEGADASNPGQAIEVWYTPGSCASTGTTTTTTTTTSTSTSTSSCGMPISYTCSYHATNSGYCPIGSCVDLPIQSCVAPIEPGDLSPDGTSATNTCYSGGSTCTEHLTCTKN